MKSALAGLKAEARTITDQPDLLVMFLPRFWGSFEARWELGKDHLVPVARTDIFNPGFTLCGHSAATDDGCDSRHGLPRLGPQAALPTGICKSCARVAKRRGYGG